MERLLFSQSQHPLHSVWKTKGSYWEGEFRVSNLNWIARCLFWLWFWKVCTRDNPKKRLWPVPSQKRGAKTEKSDAIAGNRTRAWSVAGTYLTTWLLLLCFGSSSNPYHACPSILLPHYYDSLTTTESQIQQTNHIMEYKWSKTSPHGPSKQMTDFLSIKDFPWDHSLW